MNAPPLPEVNETMRHFVTKAFKAVGFANFSPSFKPDLPVPAALKALNRPALDGMTPLNGVRNEGSCLDIPVVDWDLLFTAIEWRLRLAVGDRPAGAPAPEAGDTAGQVQVAVLDCITAMNLLHAALTIERDSVPRPSAFAAPH